MRLKQCIFALVAMLLCAFSANAQESVVAKIGNVEYTTFASAMADAKAATRDVTVEVYGAVEFVDGMELDGSYTAITFTGMSEEAKITINQTAGGDYLTAHGKTVAFNDLILAKANPAWSGNSGHMGNYFSIQGGTVTYTDCTFPNGACTSGGTATYDNCTFQNESEYGLWVYDDALVTVNGGTIDSKKGIKVYSEGEDSVTSTLTVQNATFTENVTAKPAVAVGYAQSITLIGNTYNNTTAHVELDSGSDADCEGITFVAEDSEGNDISSELTVVDRSNSSAACGVLVDGKIYTTVATAAAEATEGSTVTLLYDSTEEVELPEGVTLDKNGFTANNVTVATSGVAQVGENVFTTVLEALQYAIDNNAAELKILCDVREKMTIDFDLNINADLTITADAPVKVEFYNDGTAYDFAVGSTNNNTLTIGENVHFDLVDRVIWLGYWGNNVTVVVNGYLGGYQIWHGANTVVNGTLDSHGEAFIMRRDATLTANEGAKVNANYFQIYSGHIVAENATITAGLVWVNNNHSYGNEGTVSFELDNTEFTSNGEVKIYAGEGKIVSVTLENSSLFDAKGVVTLGDNVKVVADATSSIQDANGSVVIPVAKIGETAYATLEEAFAAAAESETITLLADATPALTSQRAITKAAVIDLGGNTLTLTEDDLYFGTTTFKNGTIVVDPSVKPSTAVFWMFADQTLTFDAVKVVATGVTGTYLIGLDGNNSDLNLLNGSEILIENTTALDLDVICVNASTGNDIVVENSKVNVTNLDGRVFFRGNYTVKDSEVSLAGITKAGFRIEAGQTLSIEGTSTVTIEGEPRDGGIHITDATATYTKAETATVNATVNAPAPVYVAKIGDVEYATLAEAVDAVEDGGTITMIANETFTENNRYNNGGWWDGLGYSGDKSFTIDLNNFTISQDGALNDYLMWFKNDGAKDNTITLKNGTLDAGTTAYCALATASSNAKKITVNLENISLINNNSNGSTVKVRGGAVLNVKDGTVITGKDSYLGVECWAATVNIYGGAEIYMNGTSSYNGCLAGTGGNGTINVYGGKGLGKSGGFIAMTSGGTINVEGGEWTANTDGAYANDNKSVLVAQSDKQYNAGAGNSIVNVTGGTFKGGYNCYGNAAGDAQINISGGNFNADPATYLAQNYVAVENNGVWNVELAAAKIGETYYATLQAAFDAVKDGETITLIDNVTVSVATAAYNDGTYIDGVRYTGDKSFTVDFNGKTVTDDGCVNDYLIYINNKGEKASEITFTNGTIVSKNGCWSAVCVNSGAATQNVVLNLNGMNITNSNDAEYSGNPVVRVRNLATVNVNDKTVITSNGASYGVAASTDGSTLNINEGATIVQQNSGTTGGNSVFAAVGGKGVINIKGGTITSDKFGVHTMTTGTPVINISGGTITAPVALKSSTNGGNGELATINVTGGTINGTLETYTENGKIVVSGGTFTVDVTEFCAEGYVCKANGDGTYGIQEAPEAGLAGEGTEANPYLISSVDDLVLFRNSVNAGETKYSAPGIYVALGADINLAGENWIGIGSMTADHGFMGNFDGKNFKIKNLTIDNPALDSDGYAYAGLFALTEGTDKNNQNFVKNLTIENVTINTTGHIASAAIAYAYYTVVDNVTVCGNIAINGGDYTAGVLAYTRRCVNASNIAIIGNENSYVKGARVVGGVISDIQMNGGLIADYSNFSAEGVAVSGTDMVGGISGIIATQTLDGATVKNVTLNSNDGRVGIVAGCFGGTSTISNVAVETVTGAAAIVGPTYNDSKAVEARIGDTYYATLQTAATAAKENETVTLIADVEATEALNINCALDLNGHSLTATVAPTALPEGYAALPNLDGKFVIGAQPTATVNNLGMTTVAAGDYSIWNGSFDQNTEDDGDMPLSFVMQFLADQDAEDMATSPYADWYGDFVITFTGLENGSFTADGCYLAGHYGSFGWVKVPVDGMTIEEGARYPVMLGVGLGQKYDYICSSVEDFKCALYLTPEILEANPNIQVKLELGVVDNSKGQDAAKSALVSNENVYSVTEYTYDAEDFVVDPNYIAELVIDDANPVDYTSDLAGKKVGKLTYKRTFIAGIWNPMFVPFEVDIERLVNEFGLEVAYYNQMISDENENGGFDYKMEVKHLTSGVISHYPLFVKVATATEIEYVAEDVVLSSADEFVITTSSVTNTFKLYGTHQAKSVSDLNGKYAINASNGLWTPSSSGIKPHRLYFEIQENNNNPFASSPAKSIGIVVRGEDGTTGVEEITGENGEEMIFDLQGRRVLEPQKGGLYIVNGKKVIY